MPLGQALQDRGCVLHDRRGLHSEGFVCIVGTGHRRPLGGPINVPKVPTERLVSTTTRRLKSSLARKPFPPLEPLR
jgi:hypothetical protein